MVGALLVDSPIKLLEKLKYEVSQKSSSNSFPELNAVRDAYHLREWIWHHYLEGQVVMQQQMMGIEGNQQDWEYFINNQFPKFQILKELCNGSKHFILRKKGQIVRALESGWDNQEWDTLPWDADGFYVELSDSSVLSISELLEAICDFWDQLFKDHALI
ncbi:hypothetical protein [Thalassospira sp.]|uniref:hypothetical protein n=1 Tax=Thalassospira sp. TaxID=1912094 RepID=UPI0032EB5B39